MPERFQWRYTRMKLLRMTGRPLAEIDAMSLEEVNDIFGYWQGEAKAMRELKWLSQ